jgi:hypothetical protein
VKHRLKLQEYGAQTDELKKGTGNGEIIGKCGVCLFRFCEEGISVVKILGITGLKIP